MPAGLIYGRTADDWETLERACLRFLVEQARLGNGRTTTYTELNTVLINRTGLPGFDFADQAGRAAMGELLGRVVNRAMSTYPNFDKLMISSLVTYLNENDAGPGFYQLARQKHLMRPGQDRLEFWYRQLHDVEDYFSKNH